MNEKQFSIWVKDSLVKQGHTTAKAEALLKSVTSTVSTFAYDLRMLKQLLRSLNRIMSKRGELVSKEKIASYFDLIVLDAATVQLHQGLDKARSQNDPDLRSYIEETTELILPLLDTFSVMSKSAIIHAIRADIDDEIKQTLLKFLSISGTRCSETTSLALTLEENCPQALRSALSLWQDGSLFHFGTLEETRKSANMSTDVFLFSR